MPKSSEEILRGLHDAFASGEYSHIGQLVDEHVRYYLPGYGRFAGTYRGIEEVVALFRQANAHSNQHTLIVRQHGVSTSDRHVAERSTRQAIVNGKLVEWNQTTLYFFDKGRIYECRIVVNDLEVYDAYWSLGEERVAGSGGDTPFDVANPAAGVP